MRFIRMFFIRRVVGPSMSPKLTPGQILLGTPVFRHLHPGQVVIIEQNGKENVKRIERIEENKIFVIGDNLNASTDSRHFGWLESKQIIGKVVWPNMAK
jgi:nickel-type superoxide dismutase maturation protease